MTSAYEIDTTSETVPLDELSIHDPQPAPAQYAEYVSLGNGNSHGVGYKIAEWRWDFLSIAEIAILRGYCTDVADDVYITTPDVDGTFMDFTATMIWPQSPEPDRGDFFKDFAIQFIKLVEVPGTT